MAIESKVTNIGNGYVSIYDSANSHGLQISKCEQEIASLESKNKTLNSLADKSDNIKAEIAKNQAEIEANKFSIGELKNKPMGDNPTYWLLTGLDMFAAGNINDRKGVSNTEFYYDSIRFGLKGINGAPWVHDGKEVKFESREVEIPVSSSEKIKYTVVSAEFLRTIPLRLAIELSGKIWELTLLTQEEKHP